MNEFTNSAGKTFKVKPFPPMLNARLVSQVKKEWEKENGVMPAVPQYHVKTATGRTESFDHDYDTEKSPEEQQAWNEYIEKKSDLENAINNRRVKAAITCMDVNPLEDSDWVSRMRFLGIDIPEDKAELLNLYAETEVFATPGQDALILLMVVSAAGGIISQEVVTSLQEQFFRQNKREAPGRTVENNQNETEESG